MRALRRSFSTPANAALTAMTLGLIVALGVPFVRWALINATWTGTAVECRARGGACWAFIGHKLGFIVFGLYPAAIRWRAGAATIVLLALVVATLTPRLWRQTLLLVWAVGLGVAYWFMSAVSTQEWGGLPITIMLTAIGLAAGFPIAILLALGRRSRRPVAHGVATAVVEVVRGIPLVAVLYLAVLIFPLALPTGIQLDKLALAQTAVVLFAAAYLSEAVRSGLQIVPKRRLEAALALGLSWGQAMRLVILPEALRVVVPSFVSIAAGFFQDTSLIVIIGLFDLLNTARLAAQDPEWLGFSTEAYLFVGLLYVIGSGAIVRYGRWLERRLSVAS
ncbi:MAG TPA: amino acid ABC transporter permease [Gemmatimonadaceae bacterium]|nr:amino acid ABC transporter permease [Gemmatimonadaceae bacterium]